MFQFSHRLCFCSKGQKLTKAFQTFPRGHPPQNTVASSEHCTVQNGGKSVSAQSLCATNEKVILFIFIKHTKMYVQYHNI
jgi:hypothetical protein